jgi:NitT/TauT family transport system substrate-binding protein
MKKNFYLFCTVLMIFLVQMGCKQKDLTNVSTRIKWFKYASYMGDYAADYWGYYKEEGLNVTIHEGGPQVDATKLVAAGSDDFGICGGDQLIVARSKGLPIVAVAALMQETPAGYMVLKNSDIYSMKDFPGHRIRIISGHNTEIEYRAVMHKLGIDTKKIKENVNSTELQLLINNVVDIEPVYLNNQPARAKSLGLEFRLFTPTDYGVRSYGNVYFTSEKMIQENPDLVLKFITAIIKGWEQSFRTPEQAIDSLIKDSKNLKKSEELEKLIATEKLMHRDDGKIGYMEKERWDELNKMLFETHIIENKVDINSLYDNQFVEKYYANKKEIK